jgi:hypothetical protein
MSSLIAAPELITTAATDLANIGSPLTAAHLTAAAPTVALAPSGAATVSHIGGIQPRPPGTRRGLALPAGRIAAAI